MHGSGVGIPQYGGARELWIALDQNLHPLRREVWKIEEYASDVAPWSRKGSCHTAGDRVRFQIDCDNRNGARGRSSRVQYQRSARHDHARILRNDFRYQRGNSRRVTFRGCKLDSVNFRDAELIDVVFDGCLLRAPDFGSARLTRVRFTDCRLDQADLSKVTLDQVDLRGAELGLIITPDSLRGAVVSTAQLYQLAPVIAETLGISVDGP